LQKSSCKGKRRKNHTKREERAARGAKFLDMHARMSTEPRFSRSSVGRMILVLLCTTSYVPKATAQITTWTLSDCNDPSYLASGAKLPDTVGVDDTCECAGMI
jgi:hypothetical protein